MTGGDYAIRDNAIVAQLENGARQCAIAARYKLTPAAISRIWRNYQRMQNPRSASERWCSLGLTTRTARWLEQEGINTVAQLQDHDFMWLLRAPNFGRHGLRDCMALLARHGLRNASVDTLPPDLLQWLDSSPSVAQSADTGESATISMRDRKSVTDEQK